MQEIGVNFVENHPTKADRCITLATCKFHPSLLDLINQLGVKYDSLTEVPLGTVRKEINFLTYKSLSEMWDGPSSLSVVYDKWEGYDYEMPMVTMGFFFYEFGNPTPPCKILECEIDGFFYFPMWIFPVNSIQKRYAEFASDNPGVIIPKKLPTPKKRVANFVVYPPKFTVCAYKFKVLGTKEL